MFSTFGAKNNNIIKNTINTAKNAVKPISGQPNNTTVALTGFFGSYITLSLTAILFIMVFSLIYLYFQTIGYTVNMGWDKLMTIFGNKEEITVTATEDNKKAGSITLEPPQPSQGGSLNQELKAALGLGPPNSSGQRDVGNPPPPAAGTLPFDRDERPSGMPGATEGDYESKDRKKRMKKKRAKDGEVFNVSRNLYTYDEAAPLCKAMGAELATYDEIVEAQKAGADWCNYGWTKGQMAVFPTSNKTYQKLQTGPPEYRNSCGKPGVNGGFFDNPELRFGVNCFGKRPEKKDTDDLLNDTDMIVPPTAEQIEFDKKVAVFREQLENISVLPWNRKSWSE
jgi:hypothetical protein